MGRRCCAGCWAEQHVEEVWLRHTARLGYTTCFLHTLRTAKILPDERGFVGALRERVGGAHPEPLRRNIVAHDHPVLWRALPS